MSDVVVSAAEARKLFAGLETAHCLIVAVSGGPDSTALLWLLARWRKSSKRGPKLLAATVDHGLRKESAAEARAVKAFAASLNVPHTTMRWTGDKPRTGVAAAAREARYTLLAKAARKARASHVVTAHTQDDQAETFLMRLSRGSGLAGLASMAKATPREDVLLLRPLLNVPKTRLLATLRKAKVAFADDPTNRDTAFARPRWRQLAPLLAAEGLDGRTISRLTERLARANEALDAVADHAVAVLLGRDAPRSQDVIEGAKFLTLPPEIRIRLVQRAVARWSYEGPAELAKIEALAAEIAMNLGSATASPFRRTLAGAMIGVKGGRLSFEAAPRRRARSTRTGP